MDLKKYIADCQLVVHAGGMGERWEPVTGGKIVKPMTEIGKKPRPMIDWVILPFVKAGIKNVFPTLWYKSDMVVSHLNEVSKQSGIRFNYLIEPTNRRLGRAGIIREGIKRGILDPRKPIISTNGSDVISVDVEDLMKFHLDGVAKGKGTTVVGADKMPTEFGILIVDSHSKSLVKFREKPMINLSHDQKIHTGMFVFDGSVNPNFMKIKEESYPINIEDLKDEAANSILKSSRVYTGTVPRHIVPMSKWVFFKSPKHYKQFGKIDFEHFLQIKNADYYLGKYKSNSSGQ